MNETGVFERHELKFLLQPRQRAALEQALRAQGMRPDEYGESSILSLYYDTPDSLLIRRSLEKPDYKEKLRLRSYGTPGTADTVFAELKKKVSGIVYKRRIALREADAMRALARGGTPEAWPLTSPGRRERQIAREIAFTLERYESLRPAMVLSYDRTAWFSPEDADLRLTFDRKIRWRQEDLRLISGPDGNLLISPELSLLELKVSAAIPLWLMRALTENYIRQTSFSKYGSAYTISLTHHHKTGGILCA